MTSERCTCLLLVAEVADDIGGVATFRSVLDLWQLNLLRALRSLGLRAELQRTTLSDTAGHRLLRFARLGVNSIHLLLEL